MRARYQTRLTQLKMTATFLLDLFAVSRRASRKSVNRRTGRRCLSCNKGRSEHFSKPVYRFPHSCRSTSASARPATSGTTGKITTSATASPLSPFRPAVLARGRLRSDRHRAGLKAGLLVARLGAIPEINPRISLQQVLPTLISEIPKVRFRQDKDPADVLVLSLLRKPLSPGRTVRKLINVVVLFEWADLAIISKVRRIWI